MNTWSSVAKIRTNVRLCVCVCVMMVQQDNVNNFYFPVFFLSFFPTLFTLYPFNNVSSINKQKSVKLRVLSSDHQKDHFSSSFDPNFTFGPSFISSNSFKMCLNSKFTTQSSLTVTMTSNYFCFKFLHVFFYFLLQ